jgi:GT2 family glycosyltransferase
VNGTQSAAHRSPGRPRTSARLIAVDDLPVARTEVELAVPPTTLKLADGVADARKIMALVRLHTHPLGVVVLDGTTDLRWSTHSAMVWSAMRDAVDGHLAADGLLGVDDPKTLTAASQPVPRCVRLRRAVMAKPPRITVIVATRERPDLLRTCLDALLGLDYPDYEIVVVDNDPDTADTANLVTKGFGPPVRYVRENRRGLASAHNRGLEEARGEVVAFVDDDVVVDRYWLTAIAEGFAADSKVGCVTGLILPAQLDTPAQLLLERHGGFDKGFGLRVFDTGHHRPDDPLFPFTAGRLGSGANMAFDTEVLRRLGGFDPAIGIGTFARGGDDLAAFFRVVLNHRLVYQPAAVVWHRHHREMAALRNQSFGYGVGAGAFLTSVLVHEPRTWPALLRRLPAGFSYAFSSSSDLNRGRYDGWPPELARLEMRGLIFGPGAYAVSRWRTRRTPIRQTPISDDRGHGRRRSLR